jgi:UDP-glucose 4-epimerase
MRDSEFGRVLVTGGCGFIGHHLVERLLALGARVTVLDDLSSGRADRLPDGAELVVGSVADGELVERLVKGCDGCFHLAAIASVTRSFSEFLYCHDVNLTGTVAVLNGVRHCGGRLVYASSSAVYGNPAELPLSSASAAAPISPYGLSKLASEWHARMAGAAFGVPSFGLRFFNVYGEGQSADSEYSGVIAAFSRRVAAGEAVPVYGSGRQSRDFVYVGDVVEALLAAWRQADASAPVEIVATGTPTTVVELAELVMELAGRRVPVVPRPPRCGDIEHSYGRGDFLRGALGRTPLPLRQGLARTLGTMPRSGLGKVARAVPE